MIALSGLLQNFDSAEKKQPSDSELSFESLEDEKLHSFEAGYGAGWDDALKAQENRAKLLCEALDDKVKQFDTSEAKIREDLTSCLLDVHRAIVECFFEGAEHAAIGNLLSARVSDELRRQAESRLTLYVSHDQIEAVQLAIGETFQHRVAIELDPDLPQKSVVLKSNRIELRLEFDSFLDDIRSTLMNLKSLHQEEFPS